jgi:hypothetical protein
MPNGPGYTIPANWPRPAKNLVPDGPPPMAIDAKAREDLTLVAVT